FQRLRRLGVDRLVVFDTPCIDAALAQRAHQFAAGGAGNEQLVAPGPVPDDLDQVRQIGRIGKPAPDFAVGPDAPVILEIVAVDLVGRYPVLLCAGAAQPHQLGQNNIGGGVGGVE